MSDKEKWLHNFITEVVDGWMLKDLERLLTDVPHRPGKTGNCNFPIALYVFACLEFLGHLTSVELISSNKKRFTQKRIMNFIDDFFPIEFKRRLQPYRSKFVKVFRNGLAHEYFAKSAGISRAENEPLFVNDQGMLVLDANRFVEAFKASIEAFKETVKNDNALVDRIVERYNTLYQKNLSFRETPTSTNANITSRANGASLPHPSITLPPEKHKP